jgi:hypothetical protein
MFVVQAYAQIPEQQTESEQQILVVEHDEVGSLHVTLPPSPASSTPASCPGDVWT